MKIKKLIVAVACATAAVAAAAMLSACSGGGATSTGTYLSENELTYANFLPEGKNYYFATSTTQQLDTFSDNTYCLTITTSTYSNISLGPDVATGDETWNDRGQTITRFYGSCTVEADPSDDTLSFVTISAPSRVVFASFGSVTLDTGSWTEAMTEAATTLASNPLGGLGIQLGEDETVSADMLLEAKVGEFPTDGIEIMVNLSACSFDQVSW